MTTSISIQFYTYLYLVHPRPPSTWASNIRLTSAYHSSGVFLVFNCPRLFNREIGHPDDCGHPFGVLLKTIPGDCCQFLMCFLHILLEMTSLEGVPDF